MTNRPLTTAVTAALLALGSTAFAGDDGAHDETTQAPPQQQEEQEQDAQTAQAEQAQEQVTVQIAESDQYGQHLTDGEGRALYLFTADEEGQTACVDACAEAWPPLTTADAEADVQLQGDGLDQAKLGTLVRADGQTQITYDGHPLYYFVKDEAPGDLKGQDVKGFDGEWYLISPEGDKVEEREQAS